LKDRVSGWACCWKNPMFVLIFRLCLFKIEKIQ
jgi:hypothetical protein